MLFKYLIYKLSGRTPHSFLLPSQQGVTVGDFLVTSHEVVAVTKYKEIEVSLNEANMSFYIKVAFCSTGRKQYGVCSGSKFKHLCLEDAVAKIEERAGIKIEVTKGRFLKGPDRIHGENIRNAFEIYGTVKSVDDEKKLLEVLRNGIGNRKSYGFGQIVLFNIEKL